MFILFSPYLVCGTRVVFFASSAFDLVYTPCQKRVDRYRNVPDDKPRGHLPTLDLDDRVKDGCARSLRPNLAWGAYTAMVLMVFTCARRDKRPQS